LSFDLRYNKTNLQWYHILQLTDDKNHDRGFNERRTGNIHSSVLIEIRLGCTKRKIRDWTAAIMPTL
jgi:hypothetical protein